MLGDYRFKASAPGGWQQRLADRPQPRWLYTDLLEQPQLRRCTGTCRICTEARGETVCDLARREDEIVYLSSWNLDPVEHSPFVQVYDRDCRSGGHVVILVTMLALADEEEAIVNSHSARPHPELQPPLDPATRFVELEQLSRAGVANEPAVIY